ncbi:MAG: enoyl-CoA hydratase-related protein [Pseudomonadota bacterium]|nr:enoyl-CoA hydratase-related protein [Pseudomonadota bacterium]
MSYENLIYEVTDGVALCTFNRVDAANAMNKPLMEELYDVAVRIDTDPAVRAAVFTGQGKIFSAGGDIRFFKSLGDKLPEFVKRMTLNLHGAISRLHRSDVPVICAVNGAAGGAGFSFAIQGDIVIAGEGSKFVSAYSRLGVSPDGSSTYFLPRLVGTKRALDLMLTNRTLTAAEAMDWGLVDRVVADDKVLDEALKLAREFAGGPTLAYGRIKRLIHQSLNESLETQMENETVGIAESMRSADGREGVAAFLEKRKPVFRGA